MKIGIVVSRFNQEIGQRLLRGAMARLHEHGIEEESILVVWVPGSIEIPILAQQIARSKQVNAIICLGVVIRGDTDHYQAVCQQVSYGCQRVSLDHHIPVIFGVLMTRNKLQALVRSEGRQHKGREAADTAVEMVKILSTYSNTPFTAELDPSRF